MAWLEMLGTILGSSPLGFYYYALLSPCSAASFSVHHARCTITYEGDNLRNALSKREYDDEMKEATLDVVTFRTLRKYSVLLKGIVRPLGPLHRGIPVDFGCSPWRTFSNCIKVSIQLQPGHGFLGSSLKYG